MFINWKYSKLFRDIFFYQITTYHRRITFNGFSIIMILIEEYNKEYACDYKQETINN